MDKQQESKFMLHYFSTLFWNYLNHPNLELCWNCNGTTILSILINIFEIHLFSENRTDQCNPDHKPTGPGHEAGYKGTGTKEDKDNHGNQLNPNNPEYGGGQKKWINRFFFILCEHSLNKMSPKKHNQIVIHRKCLQLSSDWNKNR